MLKVGLIINPWAGIGGQVALKGSDGENIVKAALLLGAEQTADKKTLQCLSYLETQSETLDIEWICAKGDMGSHCLDQTNMPYTLVNHPTSAKSSAKDTQIIAQLLLDKNVDLILFAGGDGTARDLFCVIGQSIPVLGIPAGVKIHSGVYALTPQDAARCLISICHNPIIEISQQEVRDINEDAFRQGQVQSKFFGEMITPSAPEFIQAVKMGGVESDVLLNEEIADYLIEGFEYNHLYFIGSGKTLDCLMGKLNLENTLLGVDCIFNKQLIKQDLTASEILDLMQTHPFSILISVIGGQGHIFGRGNHQFNQQVFQQLQTEQIVLVANIRYLIELNNKPLIIDSLDNTLTSRLNNRIKILTGYDQWVMYHVR